MILIPSSRDILIDEVSRGLLTPEAAEERAARENLGPLSASPDPAAFDPMTLTEWSLPMALAWITRRTIDAVRECWDEYRANFFAWQPTAWRIGLETPTYEGHSLKQRAPASVEELEIVEAAAATNDSAAIAFMSLDEAIKELFEALEAGMTRATHGGQSDSERDIVTESVWRKARIERNGRLEYVEFPPEGSLSARRYAGIRLKVYAISRIWPWPYRPAEAPRLSPSLRPDQPGYMPLYCAALWIASKGQAIDFEPTDAANWRAPYADLLSRVAAGEVQVIGLKNGVREPVPPYQFVGCKVDYPYCEAPLDLILSDEVYLSSSPNSGEEDWIAGFDDSLRNRRAEYWKRLMVANADVFRCWPFHLNQIEAPQFHSGAPGRPTSMSFVKTEYDRRCEAGMAKSLLSEEATELVSWLRRSHPTAPTLTAKTISNNLRDEHRQRFPARK